MKNLITVLVIAVLMTSCGNAHKNAIKEDLSWYEVGDMTVERDDFRIVDMELINSYSVAFNKTQDWGDDILSLEDNVGTGEGRIEFYKSTVETYKDFLKTYNGFSGDYSSDIEGFKEKINEYTEKIEGFKQDINEYNNKIQNLTDSIKVYSEFMLTDKPVYFTYSVNYSFENPLTRSQAKKNTLITVREWEGAGCTVITH
jgi:ABC-type Fe3+-citrate transport system substrate-binding protein